MSLNGSQIKEKTTESNYCVVNHLSVIFKPALKQLSHMSVSGGLCITEFFRKFIRDK